MTVTILRGLWFFCKQEVWIDCLTTKLRISISYLRVTSENCSNVQWVLRELFSRKHVFQKSNYYFPDLWFFLTSTVSIIENVSTFNFDERGSTFESASNHSDETVSPATVSLNLCSRRLNFSFSSVFFFVAVNPTFLNAMQQVQTYHVANIYQTPWQIYHIPEPTEFLEYAVVTLHCKLRFKLKFCLRKTGKKHWKLVIQDFFQSGNR